LGQAEHDVDEALSGLELNDDGEQDGLVWAVVIPNCCRLCQFCEAGPIMLAKSDLDQMERTNIELLGHEIALDLLLSIDTSRLAVQVCT